MRARAVLVALLLLPLASREPPPETGRFEYGVTEAGIDVHDVEGEMAWVRRIAVPELEGTTIRGVSGSAATDRLYISYYRRVLGPGSLLAFDLRDERVLWTRTYEPSVDNPCVTPDGRRVYVPSGEQNTSDFWFVLDGGNGSILSWIHVHPNTHNTVCGLDSRRAYLASRSYARLPVVDTTTQQVLRRVGPFGGGIRPFTINGRQTLVYANVNGLLGFEVADLRTGAVLHRVTVPGYTDDGSSINPTHGIALTPGERELWIADKPNHAVHAFDVGGVPAERPRKVASIHLSGRANWVTITLDGRYVLPSTGEVIARGARTIVGSVVPTRHWIGVDMEDGDPVRVTSNIAVGHVR